MLNTMDRKKFIKNLGLGVIATPLLSSSLACGSDTKNQANQATETDTCKTSPRETAGPFPLKSPADVVRENIIGDRNGIPLVINLTIQNTNNNCEPLADVYVDIWQCDAHGNYSEYSGQLDGNFTNKNFLRGRQTTNAQGKTDFVSIYPGWYPGRAPHLHLEVLDKNQRSLLVTQIAFPDDISNTVYATDAYNGEADTSSTRDWIFRNSLDANMADSITGSIKDGFTLNKIIKVAG